MKTLIVVSGGDAPGINAFLHSYARLCPADTLIGAQGGLPAVLSADFVPLSARILAPFAAQAGSYLASSREPVLAQPDAQARLLAVLEAHNIDNVILLGGNGTLHHVLPLLVSWSVPCVGIPVTIDNDVPATDYSLGFDSACNYGYHAIDGLLATARALPGRIFMVETLGGNTGMLALAIAAGGGAHAVLLPEFAYEDAWLGERLLHAVHTEGYALLVLSEGVPASRQLAETIPQWTGIRMRDIRLGHAQRGGTPTHKDRTFALEAAQLAKKALLQGAGGAVVVMRGASIQLMHGTLEHYPPPKPDAALYALINGLAHGE